MKSSFPKRDKRKPKIKFEMPLCNVSSQNRFSLKVGFRNMYTNAHIDHFQIRIYELGIAIKWQYQARRTPLNGNFV